MAGAFRNVAFSARDGPLDHIEIVELEWTDGADWIEVIALNYRKYHDIK